ncbi:uncharacterized protein A4U43_C07F27500, partial [Asparagus officinalis]
RRNLGRGRGLESVGTNFGRALGLDLRSREKQSKVTRMAPGCKSKNIIQLTSMPERRILVASNQPPQCTRSELPHPKPSSIAQPDQLESPQTIGSSIVSVPSTRRNVRGATREKGTERLVRQLGHAILVPIPSSSGAPEGEHSTSLTNEIGKEIQSSTSVHSCGWDNIDAEIREAIILRVRAEAGRRETAPTGLTTATSLDRPCEHGCYGGMWLAVHREFGSWAVAGACLRVVATVSTAARRGDEDLRRLRCVAGVVRRPWRCSGGGCKGERRCGWRRRPEVALREVVNGGGARCGGGEVLGRGAWIWGSLASRLGRTWVAGDGGQRFGRQRGDCGGGRGRQRDREELGAVLELVLKIVKFWSFP